MKKNLTDGSLPRTMFRFSLPFFFSYFLQTLYGLADLFIIGQFDGVDCTTAVSVGSQVMHMVTVIIVGLAMGSTVMIGRAVGAGDKRKADKAIGNTVVLFLGLSVFMALLLFVLVHPILTALSIPAEARSEAAAYLGICFAGIPFITAYNIISAIYRGLGDSKTPMFFVAVSCAANIVLDYIFIGCMDMNAEGAALGTTLSQALSVVIALFVISKRERAIRPSLSDLCPDPGVFKELLGVGVPVSLQDGFIQVSFLAITVIVNRRGLTDAAAVGIVEKIISFIFLVPSTLLSSVSALASQNLGAGKKERAEQTLRYAILFGVIYGLAAGILMQFAAGFFVGLFTGDGNVIAQGAQYMHSYVWDCLFAGVHFSFSGYFCAVQRSGYSFLHNIISILCVRIPFAWILSSAFADTMFPLGFAPTLGSMLSVFVCLVLFARMKKQE